MIGRLTGIVLEFNDDHIVLDVGGVGYNVFTSNKTARNLQLGEKISLYIEHHISENTVRLYGFTCATAQKITQLLIKVKGINYKTAITLLDHLEPDELISCIQSKNEIRLRVKGVGEKLVQRIITETHEKFLQFSVVATQDIQKSTPQITHEAISALIKLGFQAKNSQKIVSEILEEKGQIETDKIIKLALKML